MYRGGSGGGGGGGGEGGIREREGGTEVKVSKNGRLDWGKQELYCLIKLFYRPHIPVKSFVGQMLFNATI